MIRASLSFFALALIAIIFGASGIAGFSFEIGKLLLFVFLVLSVISFLGSLLTGKKPNLL